MPPTPAGLLEWGLERGTVSAGLRVAKGPALCVVTVASEGYNFIK